MKLSSDIQRFISARFSELIGPSLWKMGDSIRQIQFASEPWNFKWVRIKKVMQDYLESSLLLYVEIYTDSYKSRGIYFDKNECAEVHQRVQGLINSHHQHCIQLYRSCIDLTYRLRPEEEQHYLDVVLLNEHQIAAVPAYNLLERFYMESMLQRQERIKMLVLEELVHLISVGIPTMGKRVIDLESGKDLSEREANEIAHLLAAEGLARFTVMGGYMEPTKDGRRLILEREGLAQKEGRGHTVNIYNPLHSPVQVAHHGTQSTSYTTNEIDNRIVEAKNIISNSDLSTFDKEDLIQAFDRLGALTKQKDAPGATDRIKGWMDRAQSLASTGGALYGAVKPALKAIGEYSGIDTTFLGD